MSDHKYWQGIEELTNPKQANKLAKDEFRSELPFEDVKGILDAPTGRRDFLKYLGFSTAAALAAASCKIPERKARTWAQKPNDMTPGVALYYASTFVDAGEAIPVLVKTREGRPIKLEGNKDSLVYAGGTSARAQASVLSLYDVARLRQPEVAGKKVNTWEEVDQAVAAAMSAVGSAPIYLVTGTINSPTISDLISKFQSKYSNVKHVQYDAISYSGLLDAAQAATGKRAIPFYDFGAAKTIVSIGADFLGTWLTPTLFAKAYSKGRRVSATNTVMSKHYQIEGVMTTTGGAADERVTCRPSQYGAVAVALLNAVNGSAANTGNATLDATINKAAADLKKGAGLVVCDSNDKATQEVVFAINSAIGAFGTTVHPATSNNAKKGNDADMNAFVTALLAGQVGGAIFYDCNPVYDNAKGADIAKAIKGLKLSISCNDRNDETTEVCNIKAPASHWLESWGDSEYLTGHYSLQQPTISNLFKTRQFGESLIRWMGDATTTFKDVFTQAWVAKAGGQSAFDALLQKGVQEPASVATGGGYSGSAAAAVSAISAAPKPSGKEVLVYEKIGIGAGGVWSNNPWLQEMPDPVTKCTWDNYIMISPKHAKALGAELTDLNEVVRDKKVMKITVGGVSMNLPVAVVPGVHDDVIGVAVGYGRGKGVGRAATADDKQGGKNAFKLTGFANGAVSYSMPVKIEPTGDTYPLAITQTHHSYEGRHEVVQEQTLAEFAANPKARYEERMHALHHYTEDWDEKAAEIAAKHSAKHGGGEHGAGHGTEHAGAKIEDAHAADTHSTDPHAEAHSTEAHGGAHSDHDVERMYRKNGTLYGAYESMGVKWGLSIDLNSCTGCGACTIACQAENNVSVVGKNQVMLVHDMHWLRIDRYYTSTTNDAENSDSIQTVFMPMMCQHCDNAPCENVCPVNATNHSSEGFNQMAYNRCIGTRYCANNCPYKVRRFNWRDWNGADSFADNLFEDGYRDDINDDLTRMVLNPDVTVRSRGVIEKCSMCVQRTQLGKQKAKQENRALTDSDAQSACAQACPTDAIVFGNVNDPESAISKIRNVEGKERLYYALEELHVLPNVNYLYKVRNSDKAGAPHAGGAHDAHGAKEHSANHAAGAAHTSEAAHSHSGAAHETEHKAEANASEKPTQAH